MNARKVSAFGLIVLVNQFALADASYQSTTQITGGTLVNQVKQTGGLFGGMTKKLFAPTNTLTMVHGNQKAVVTKETTEITDLDQGTITIIDNTKKTYSVMTFADMIQAFTGASKQMQAMQAQAKQSQDQLRQAESQMPTSNLKTTFDTSVKNTGVTKVVNGLTAQQQIITLTMKATVPNAPAADGATPTAAAAPGTAAAGTAATAVVPAIVYTVTTEAWIAPDPPEVQEVKDFDMRMGQKMMQGVDMPAMAAQMKASSSSMAGMSGMAGLLGGQPGASEAMAQMAKEMAKLKGTRVLEVTSVGGTGIGIPPAGSDAAAVPGAAPASATPSTGQVAGQIATDTATQTAAGESDKLGVFGSALTNSVLGAFHRKKPAPAPAPAPATATAPTGEQTATSATLMEMTTQETNFSTEAIPPSVFVVPAGYTKAPSPFAQMAK